MTTIITRPVEGRITLTSGLHFSRRGWIEAGIRGAKWHSASLTWSLPRAALPRVIENVRRRETVRLQVVLHGSALNKCTVMCAGASEATVLDCVCCCAGLNHGGGDAGWKPVGDYLLVQGEYSLQSYEVPLLKPRLDWDSIIWESA